MLYHKRVIADFSLKHRGLIWDLGWIKHCFSLCLPQVSPLFLSISFCHDFHFPLSAPYVWSLSSDRLIFRWSAVSHAYGFLPYSYNKSQPNAQFLYFILVKNSTCFGQTYCPSSGVLILYSQQLVFFILFMSASEVELSTSLADSQHNWYDKYQLLWIQYWDAWWWTVSLSETCRVLYQNKVEK